jgi:hypothetical protein
MTEPTTQALAELRKLAEAAKGAKLPYSVAAKKALLEFQCEAVPSQIIELLDALEAQAREIERLNHKDKLITKWTENGELIERLYSAGLEQEREISTLRAELAAIRAVPVADVNAGLVEAVALPGDLVIKALLAMDAEARKRGGMFPQTLAEQKEDTKAVRNVIASLEFYTSERQCNNGWPSVKDWPALPATQQVQKGGE